MGLVASRGSELGTPTGYGWAQGAALRTAALLCRWRGAGMIGAAKG